MILARMKRRFLNSIVILLIFVFLSAAVYAEREDAWTKKAPMATPRSNHQVSVLLNCSIRYRYVKV